MVLHNLYVVGVPVLFGVVPTYFLLKRLALKQKVTFLSGFLGWILFILSSFVGEIVAHALFPRAYAGIGDNPAQIGGLMAAILFSFLFCPLLWASFKWRKIK